MLLRQLYSQDELDFAHQIGIELKYDLQTRWCDLHPFYKTGIARLDRSFSREGVSAKEHIDINLDTMEPIFANLEYVGISEEKAMEMGRLGKIFEDKFGFNGTKIIRESDGTTFVRYDCPMMENDPAGRKILIGNAVELAQALEQIIFSN
jgi:hypothetical protein